MINIILVSVAVLVLIVAGILLEKRKKKEQHIEKEIVVKENNFPTKYDEITHYYNSGALSEEEYKSQIKNYIN